ncbi:alpha/beta hydrolase family protein [Streptomyces pactum]|uniref:alpha/beta hydrolase family protein n=1 Tax=Streptomyces pactum TaxID=68249 RepID=UPI00370135F4
MSETGVAESAPEQAGPAPEQGGSVTGQAVATAGAGPAHDGAAAGARAVTGAEEAAAVTGAEEAAFFALAAVPPDATVAYGSHPDQVVDLYLPPGDVDPGRRGGADGAPAPVVLLLHGGFWRQAFDRLHLTPCAAALARAGVPVALAEYRRVGGAGGWPQTFEDVAAARDAVRRHPVAAGRPLVVAGHSAGGHLALWLAATGAAPGDRVVAVAPVADLARAHELGLSQGAVAALLGGPERVAGLLARTDPVRLPPAPVPVTVLHGTADPDVPVELSRRYVAAVTARADTAAGAAGARPDAAAGARSGAAPDGRPGTAVAPSGVRPVLRELPGAGHFVALTPGTGPFRELLDAIRHPPPYHGESAGPGYPARR